MHPITVWIDETLRQVLRERDAFAVKEMLGDVVLTVEVTPRDDAVAGGIIGRDGMTINAVRHLAQRMGRTSTTIVDVKIEVADGKFGRRGPQETRR